MAKKKKVKLYKAKLVNWFKCVYCKEKFWWWLLPFKAGGRHAADCPVKLKQKKPKFRTIKPPMKGRFGIGKKTTH